MTEERKLLYRELVRWAMIDMRMYSAWAYSSGWLLLLRRRRSHRQILRFLHAMNDWLHNIALYSVDDFVGFKEERFWQDYRHFRSRYPAGKWAALTESAIDKLKASTT